MAKQRVKANIKGAAQTPVAAGVSTATKPFLQLSGWPVYLIIFLFSSILYSNTLWNQYTVDDAVVITENRFTKKGLNGAKDILTHDMFEGVYGERGARMITGGRYRPLSMFTLCLEYEITRKLGGDKRGAITDENITFGTDDVYLSPLLSHAINILLFAFTCMAVYYLLSLLIKRDAGKPFYPALSFVVTMLYAAHPIHTEAVANIKGRDELMCMLFAILALTAAVRYAATGKLLHLLWGAPLYFLSLLSKENAITFFAIVPLAFYFFTPAKLKEHAIALGTYAVPVAFFLLLRGKLTQTGLTQDSVEILNNPFVLATGTQKFATIVLTFLLYLKLLAFPHPLTHDYYYNQIPYVDAGDILFILSFIINPALIAYALIQLRRKNIASFGILFYFITFSVVSNVFFTVGVLMNERFIYMSSLGFSIASGYLLVHYIKNTKAAMAILIAVLSLYSIKTFSRNYDWKSNLNLFSADVKVSPNSARLRTALGNELTIEADKQADTIAKNALLDTAIYHLNEGLTIYATNAKAWLLLGNALYKRHGNAAEAIPYYEKAAQYYGGINYDAYFNLGVVYNETNAVLKAKQALLIAYEAKPNQQVELRLLLAQVYGKLNRADSSDYWLGRAAELKQLTAPDYYAVGTALGKTGNNIEASLGYFKKAIELNPNEPLYYEDLGVAYGLIKRYGEAIKVTEALLKVNPNYVSAYKNLSILYYESGRRDIAEQYHQKFLQLTGGR